MAEVEIKIKDLPEHIHSSLLDILQHYMVCLFDIDVEKRNVTALGSGTFVQSGDEHGILTAAHVVDALSKKDRTAIFLQSGKGPLAFEKGTLEYLCCDNANHAEAGPDIGFIRLPQAKIGSIKAIRSFVNLDKQIEKLEEETPKDVHGVWCGTGFPEVWGDQKLDGEILRTKVFGFVGVGTADRFEVFDEHDYIWAGVDLCDEGSLPNDYRGMSGGGLWQVTLNLKDDNTSIRDQYLSEVIYYQTDIEGNERFLKCHGRKSIYEYLVPALIHRKAI